MTNDDATTEVPRRDVELDFMVSGARNLRSRGQDAAADRLERAAYRLWQLRTAHLVAPTAPPDGPAAT